MTRLETAFKRLQQSVETDIKSEVRYPLLPPYYTNNENRQRMMYYEMFRQVAYFALRGCCGDLALSMMTEVAKEVRACVHEMEATGGYNENACRKTWTEQTSFEKLDWFHDWEEIDEIP